MIFERKAQASMEYLLVAAFILMIVVPTTYVFYTYSQKSNVEISQGQINRFGTDIVNTAEEVYYRGPPSKITIKETLPSGITNITILNDWSAGINELVVKIRFEKESEMVFSSKVNINGTFASKDFSAGVKNIIIEAKESSPPYVLINIT